MIVLFTPNFDQIQITTTRRHPFQHKKSRRGEIKNKTKGFSGGASGRFTRPQALGLSFRHFAGNGFELRHTAVPERNFFGNRRPHGRLFLCQGGAHAKGFSEGGEISGAAVGWAFLVFSRHGRF